MRIRYIPADPAGNLTALTLTQVRPEERAAVAAQMMARCPEGFEQVGFIGKEAAKAALPRLDMMGGEFCGNAARAFACWVDRQRGGGERRMRRCRFPSGWRRFGSWGALCRSSIWKALTMR